jgi:hypothetical protein
MRTLEDSHLPALPQMELPLMSSVAASPAKTSALRARARDLRASAAAYGRKSPDFLASYAPATSSWKTSQRCLVEGWTRFSGTWPRSGMMQNGIAYRLLPLAPLTKGTASGLWRTPTAEDCADRAFARNSRGEPKLSAQVKMLPTPTSRDWKDGSATACANVPVNGLLRRAVHQFNTPRTTPRTARELDGVSPLGNGGLNPTWVEALMGFPSGWSDVSDEG